MEFGTSEKCVNDSDLLKQTYFKSRFVHGNEKCTLTRNGKIRCCFARIIAALCLLNNQPSVIISNCKYCI